MKNKFGLSRKIPSSVRRVVRQSCGFGCVLCGAAIIQYEHFDPEFREASSHDPNGIALLCGGCHDRKTRGLISQSKIRDARLHPFCHKEGHGGRFELDVGVESFLLRIHELEFTGIPETIIFNGCKIFSIKKPEVGSKTPRISANFYDAHGHKIGKIFENMWIGDPKALDIEWTGKKLKVCTRENKLALVLSVRPPNAVVIEKMNLFYDGSRIVVDDDGITLSNGKSQLNIHRGVKESVANVEHGLRIDNGGISLGTGKNLGIAGAVSSAIGIVGNTRLDIRPMKSGEFNGVLPDSTLVQDISVLNDDGTQSTLSIAEISISVVDE